MDKKSLSYRPSSGVRSVGSTPKRKRRAILKNGKYNIIKPKFPRRYIYYLKDPFNSLVDAEWKWTLQVLVIGFTGCWLFFALIWWLIAFVHRELHGNHSTGSTPCVLNVHGFHSSFLYSLETQITTGYGSRAITEECPEAIFILCAQCIIGMIVDSFTVGVVFAKLTRPMLTNHAIQFTQNAVICMHDGGLCLMLRAGHLRNSRLIGTRVQAVLFHNETTKEGERLKHFETELEIQCDDQKSDPFIIWPVTVIHKIDKTSPFYKLSATEMLKNKFEIVAILDGTVESTGQSTHAKTSYLPNEILWGQRFEDMVKYNKNLDCYEADYKAFDKTVTAEMPFCAAAELSASATDFSNFVGQSNTNMVKEHEILSASRKYLPTGILQASNNNHKGRLFYEDVQNVIGTISDPSDRSNSITDHVYISKNRISSLNKSNPKSRSEVKCAIDMKYGTHIYRKAEDGNKTPPFPKTPV